MLDRIDDFLEAYRGTVVQIFVQKFNRMILYGSYARGDYGRDSDIDIMILADVEPDEVSGYANQVYDMTYDFEMKYGIEINPSVQSAGVYEHWKNTYPFFMNIEKDGVAV